MQSQFSNDMNALEFFLSGAEHLLKSVNSENLINHSSMNLGECKDPVSHVCIAGDVVASWSLTQEVVGSSLVTVMANILSLNSIQRIQ